MPSPYKDIEELAAGVRDLSLLDSHYIPLNDIKEFIESLPKPDLFVSHTPDSGINIYSNHPQMLGDILVLESQSEDTLATELSLYNPSQLTLSGNYEEWYYSFEGEKAPLSLKTFLENFITKDI